MKTSTKQSKILKADNIYLLVLGVVLAIQFATFFAYYSQSWVADMAISFAPYSTAISVLFVLAGLLILFKLKRASIMQWAILFVAVLMLAVNTIPVYSWLFLVEVNSASESQVRLASFNKLVINDDLNAIKKEINPDKYDLVAISEITEDDFSKISPAWKHSFITSCDCDPAFGVEIALLSKYEIKSPKTIAATSGYGVMLSADAIIDSKSNDRLRVNAIHPPAPVSNEEFIRRNEMLENVIAPEISKYKSKSVLVGDMNLSPYSNSYKKFTKNINSYINTGKGNQVYRTWCLGEFGLACAPIDHIFVTKDIAARNFQVKSVNGSDHYLVSTDIVLK